MLQVDVLLAAVPYAHKRRKGIELVEGQIKNQENIYIYIQPGTVVDDPEHNILQVVVLSAEGLMVNRFYQKINQ